MSRTSDLDFLPLNRGIRVLIVDVSPAFVAIGLGLWLHWYSWNDLFGGQLTIKAWAGGIHGVFTVFISVLLMRPDLPRLLKANQYLLTLFGFYFNRAALVLLGSMVFSLLPAATLPWYDVVIYSVALWLFTSALAVMWIELGMSKALRRPPKLAAIAAVTESSVAFAQGLTEQRFVNLIVTGFFEDRDDTRIPAYTGFKVLGRFDDIPAYLNAHALHHVIVSLPTQASYRFGFVLDQLLDSTCSVHYLHDFLLFKPIREAMTTVGNLSIFTIIDAPSGDLDRLIKRGLDIVGALLALILLGPLLLIVALWIKLDSKGAALFTQYRWGAGAEPFQIYKFRSMTAATSEAAASGNAVQQTTKNDMRVTKVGAFIRRTSIDELPQLFNILKGDMSFVGPRPHANVHNQEYRRLIKGYMLRHKVKPGLTGWAQIHGLRGETDTLDKMAARVAYDLEYLRLWTPLLDIYIILRTAWVVLNGKNAY